MYRKKSIISMESQFKRMIRVIEGGKGNERIKKVILGK